MDRRADALCGAAEMVLAIERHARAVPGLVATVGRIEAKPGAVNVVPGLASFTLDLRAFEDDRRVAALEAMLVEGRDIADRRGLRLRHRIVYDQTTTRSDPGLLSHLASAMEERQLRPISIPSGAGHDGLAIAALCPMAMLFVRCRGGVSHHPAEEVENADMEIAARILKEAILHQASAYGAASATCETGSREQRRWDQPGERRLPG